MFVTICVNAIIISGDALHLWMFRKTFSCGRGRHIIAVMITPVKFIIVWRQLVFMRAMVFVCFNVHTVYGC